MKLLIGLSCLLVATSACTVEQKEDIKNYLLCELKGLNVFKFTDNGFEVNIGKYFSFNADTKQNIYNIESAYGEAFHHGHANDEEQFSWNLQFTDNSFISKSSTKQNWSLHPIYQKWFPKISALNPKVYKENWEVSSEWDIDGQFSAVFKVDFDVDGKVVSFTRSIETADIEINQEGTSFKIIYSATATSELLKSTWNEFLINVGTFDWTMDVQVRNSCYTLSVGCGVIIGIKGDTMFKSNIDANLKLLTNKSRATISINPNNVNFFKLVLHAGGKDFINAKRYFCRYTLKRGQIKRSNNLFNVPSLTTFNDKILPKIVSKGEQFEILFNTMYYITYDADYKIFAKNVIYGLVYIEQLIGTIDPSILDVTEIITVSKINSEELYSLYNEYALADFNKFMVSNGRDAVVQQEDFNETLVNLAEIARNEVVKFVIYGMDQHVYYRNEVNRITGKEGEKEFRTIYQL